MHPPHSADSPAEMSFLTIPSQEGLFTTVKGGRSSEEAAAGKSSVDDVDGEDEDDDDDDDDDDDVRFIPRCSPIPRKRGQSLYDETAEYMRIQQALAGARRRVCFADTTGGDLVEVKEFVQFESDEEEDGRFEEEEMHYRKPLREPTYQVVPEFNMLEGRELSQAVHANKVEVELLSPVEDEPLAFSGLVRVLNISFHKAVYIRSTMDHWASYFDYPAEYVQGSHHGETDQFSFKLCFAPPYHTHGSRIEFVVRYETSEGDYWANNSHMNYVVSLLLSYEEDLTQMHTDTQDLKGILKPPRVYSMDDDYEQDDEDKDDPGSSQPEPLWPTPVIIHPEIDLETSSDPKGQPLSPDRKLQPLDGALNTSTLPLNSSCVSSETTPQTTEEESSFSVIVSRSNESQHSPTPPCELDNQTLFKQSDPPAHFLRPTPIGCMSLEGEAWEKKECSALTDLEASTATNLSTTGAETQPTSITEGENKFPKTLEANKREKVHDEQNLEGTVTEEGPHLTILTPEQPHVDPTKECPGLQTETPHLNTTPSEEQTWRDDAQDAEHEEASQGLSRASGEGVLSSDGSIPSISNARTTPTAVIPGEQFTNLSSRTTSQTTDDDKPIASPSIKPFEILELFPTTESRIFGREMGSTEEYKYLKQHQLMNTDGEEEQDPSGKVSRSQAVVGSSPEDHVDPGRIPETSRTVSLSTAEVSEEQAAFSERTSEFLQTEPRLQLYETAEAEGFICDGRNDEKSSPVHVEHPSLHPSGFPASAAAKRNSPGKEKSLFPSLSGEPEDRVRELLEDTATMSVQGHAVGLLKETSPGVGGLKVDLEKTSSLAASRECEGRMSHDGANHDPPGSPPDYECFPTGTSRSIKVPGAAGLSQIAAVQSEGSASSSLHDENTTSSLLFPKAERLASPGAEREAATLPAVTGTIPTMTDVDTLDAVRNGEEEEGSPQISPDTSVENRSSTLSQAAKPSNPRPERNVNGNLVAAVVFLCGAIFLCTVSQEHSALFFMGLFFVSLCF